MDSAVRTCYPGTPLRSRSYLMISNPTTQPEWWIVGARCSQARPDLAPSSPLAISPIAVSCSSGVNPSSLLPAPYHPANR